MQDEGIHAKARRPPPPPADSGLFESSDSPDDSSPAVPAHLAEGGVTPSAMQDDATTPDGAPVIESPKIGPEIERPRPKAVGAEPPSVAPAAGAHLQLPSIDFSMPDFARPESSTAGDAAPPPPSELPAHLQLPSFPDFELPPIPGAAIELGSGGLENKIVDGGGDQSAVAAAAKAAIVLPPKLPAPPPLRPRGKAPSVPPSAAPAVGLPDLPALGLPTLASASKPKDPTLLHSDTAMQIVADMQHKKTSPAVFVAGILVVGVLAVGGVLWWYGPGTVLGWFRAPDTHGTTMSERERANEAFVEGVKAYQAEKFPVAVKLFTTAVTLDPAHADAHRSLGIAYAKTNQPKLAVEHYETYLKLDPNAPDSTTVRKFIEDYNKAQMKVVKKK
jgi:hypothetical protein